MDSTGYDEDQPSTASDRMSNRVIFAIIVVQIIIALVSYPFLPALVPMHWNINGQVDSYAPRWVSMLLSPGMSIGLYLLIRVLFWLGPNISNGGQRANLRVVNLIIIAVLLFMLLIQIVTTAIGLGFPIDMAFVMNLALSLLLIFLGNYMGKLRRNFWVGIRTPWTILNETVWERTHRLGGWLFVLAGLIGLVTTFIPPLRFWGVMSALFAVIVILIVYSYMEYERVTRE
jgi:uncharacterized membrane protein